MSTTQFYVGAASKMKGVDACDASGGRSLHVLDAAIGDRRSAIGWQYPPIVLTAYGVVVITFMMLMYALEHRDPRFVLAFAAGCALSSSYGFLSGAWPFGVVEAVWAAVAVQRFVTLRRQRVRPD